jgi:hypothetical protein
MSERPRKFNLSPDDHGGVAVVVSTICMTWSILCLLVRFYVRYSDLSAASWGSDDYLATIATVRRCAIHLATALAHSV